MKSPLYILWRIEELLDDWAHLIEAVCLVLIVFGTMLAILLMGMAIAGYWG